MSGSRGSRRSDDALRRIEDMLAEMPETTEAEHQAAKIRTQARLEEVFPGITEDEQTPSGVYEPSREHFPSNYAIRRPTIASINSPSSFTDGRTEYGTGPELPAPRLHHFKAHRAGNEQFRIPLTDDDLDERTPEFGTSRDFRSYAGFDGGVIREASSHAIDSPEYWDEIDAHHQEIGRQARVREERLVHEGSREWLPGREPSELEQPHFNPPSRRQPTATRRPFAPRGSRGVRTNMNTGAELAMSGQPFRAGARGSTIRGEVTGGDTAGRLEGSAEELFNHHVNTNQIDYVVYSYNTPIAWRHSLTGDWHVPTQRHSVTTAKHQNAIRRALHNSGARSPQVEAQSALHSMSHRTVSHRNVSGNRLPQRFYNANFPVDVFSRFRESENLGQQVDSLVDTHMRDVIQPELERRHARNLARRRTRRRPDERHGQSQLPLE